MEHFADRLCDATQRRGNPVVVGLDPRTASLPTVFQGSDDSFQSRADAFREFCRGVIDVVAPLVPAVKPQMAFFEQLGPAGMTALADVIRYARQKELLVILDGKRNDIGSTAQAYAEAYLGDEQTSAWGADSLTVSPYLGDDSLDPFVKVGQQRGAGIFVLVKTSNPGGGLFQDLKLGERPLYRFVAQHVEQLASSTAGNHQYGLVGGVVGATYPDQLAELRSAMPHTLFLVPGFGAQGGAAKDVADAFDTNGFGAVINSSRGIIFAHARTPYKERFGEARWQEAVEAATRDMIEMLRTHTPAGKLGDK